MNVREGKGGKGERSVIKYKGVRKKTWAKTLTKYIRADETTIGNGTTHAGDQCNATLALVLDHLAGDGLRGHEDTGDIDAQQPVGILEGVVEGRGLLLDAGGGDEAVHTAVLIGDGLDEGVEAFDVAHVGAMVEEGGAQFVLGAISDLAEGRIRLEKAVDGVD